MRVSVSRGASASLRGNSTTDPGPMPDSADPRRGSFQIVLPEMAPRESTSVKSARKSEALHRATETSEWRRRPLWQNRNQLQ